MSIFRLYHMTGKIAICLVLVVYAVVLYLDTIGTYRFSRLWVLPCQLAIRRNV